MHEYTETSLLFKYDSNTEYVEMPTATFGVMVYTTYTEFWCWKSDTRQRLNFSILERQIFLADLKSVEFYNNNNNNS